jgi:molybdopterin molybdotransferase
MLSPSEARRRILERLAPCAASESVPLAEACGRILARDAVSDVDLPPFEKSMMDGYALASADWPSSGAAAGSLVCVGESRAGAPFEGALESGQCVEIFTGAELPRGADAVAMVEHTRREGARVTLERPLLAGENVGHRGEIARVDQVVFAPGRRLSPADLSVLASIGVEPVAVRARLTVSVLTTGDELVPPGRKPGRGQIREGNTLFLAAACERAGQRVRRAGIVPDDPVALERAFAQALDEGDVLITTGGVSVGKYDLVGGAFERLGVEPILHKVAIKPGRPIWFGLRGAQPVFGLPGNPVSALLGFEVFVRPALARLAGAEAREEEERLLRGRWCGKSVRALERQDNLPVRVAGGSDGVLELHPIPYGGSADILAASRADAFAVVAPGSELCTGELVDYRPLS